MGDRRWDGDEQRPFGADGGAPKSGPACEQDSSRQHEGKEAEVVENRVMARPVSILIESAEAGGQEAHDEGGNRRSVPRSRQPVLMPHRCP